MGWQWVSLILMLALWFPRDLGIWVEGPGWWRWVVLAPWLPGVPPCLLCFGPPLQWARLCRDVTGALPGASQHQRCLKALVQAAAPLAAVTVGSGQREALREIVMDALRLLEVQRGTELFEVSLQEAVDGIWKKLRQLEEAPACVPPCGYQLAARIFQCATCRLVDCQFPLDCPVQDVWAREGEAVMLHCVVPFATPPDLPITWMFAKDLRTQDLALFEELQGGMGGPPTLILQDPPLGTIACSLGAHAETLARKYFFLNVSIGTVEAERRLQAQFRAVLRWPHSRTPPHPRMLLRLGLALGLMGLILLLVFLLAAWRPQGPPGNGSGIPKSLPDQVITWHPADWAIRVHCGSPETWLHPEGV
ncbi:sperm acrosome membrane-associated protein 6 [Dromaius novaehollandiae]|uniref:sperm acrosome membrane-associated protein 6 n=1 Tax=Dromaius novaehollandiae TaxID=8790 RepID=UPI00311D530E